MSVRKIIFSLLIIFPFVLKAEKFAGDYPDYSEMVAEIYQLEKEHPELVEIVEYGESLEGRSLLAIHIFRKNAPVGLSAMVSGNIHGNEMVGNRMAMAIARRLVEGDGKDPWISNLLDKMEFWILPCINPDGYFHTVEMYMNGEYKGQRKNMHNVDLNRNFLLPGPRKLKINWAGSKDPNHPNYYGPYPLSEPETQAIKRFLDEHQIFASINFHSVAGVLFPARCTHRKCAKLHQKMGKAFRKHQPAVKYIYVKWPNWIDTFTGELEDMQYHFYGTLAIDIEIGRSGKNAKEAKKAFGRAEEKLNPYKLDFWGYNPINLEFWIENDRDATLYALEKAYELTSGKPIVKKER